MVAQAMQTSAKEFREATLQNTTEITEKLRKGYALQMQAHNTTFAAAAREVVAEAQEKWDVRESGLSAVHDGTSSLYGLMPYGRTCWLQGPDWQKQRATLDGRPPLILVDLTFALPSEKAAEAMLDAIGTSGAIALITSSPAPELAPCLLQEQEVLNILQTSATSALRVFLQWAGSVQIGYLTFIFKHTDMEAAKAASPLLARILSSEALAQTGCLLQLPPLAPEEKFLIKEGGREGRVMFAAQRGKAFYEKVLTGVGAITWGMSTGRERLDFRVLELDGGVGDCFKFVQSIGQDDPAEKLPEMCWIGGVSPTSICHSSKQRHDVLEKIVQEATSQAGL